MAERDGEVCGVQAGQLRLRLLGSACDGCAGGCAGRCSLFAGNGAGEFAMPAPAGLVAAPGQRLAKVAGTSLARTGKLLSP